MGFYTNNSDKQSGDGLAITEWNDLSNSVAGNSGLTLALSSADKIGIGTKTPAEKLTVNGGLSVTGNTTITGNVGIGTTSPGASLSIATAAGKESSPDGTLHITNSCILFGGDNTVGKEANSAQISAGKHQANSLNLIGMSSNTSAHTRRIDAYAEGGFKIHGTLSVTSNTAVTGSVTATNFIGDGSQLTNLSVGATGLNIATESGSKVGIGTSEPQSKLHVTGKVDIHQVGISGGQNRFTGLFDSNSNNGRAQFVLSSSYSDLVIASSQVNNNHGSTLTFAAYNPTDASEHRKWVMNQGNWGSRKQFLDFGYADRDEKNPHLNINSTDTVLTLDGVNKRVGIGANNPSAPLSIGAAAGKENNPDGTLHITNSCILFGGSNNGKQVDSAQISAGKHRANSLNIVGMSSNKSESTRKIDAWAEGGFNIHGASNMFTIATSTEGLIFRLRTSERGGRQIVWDGDTNWDASSDENLKTDIENEGNILNRLMKLNVKNFLWKDDPKRENKLIGFVAQDVKPLFPSLVGKMKDPETQESTLTLKYANFGILAVGAIKELKLEHGSRIAAFEQEIADLKKRLDDRS